MSAAFALIAEAPTASLAYLLTYLPEATVRQALALVATTTSDPQPTWARLLGSDADAFRIACIEAGWLRANDAEVTLCPDAPGLAGWLPRLARRSLRRTSPPAAVPVKAPAPPPGVVAAPAAPAPPPVAPPKATRAPRKARPGAVAPVSLSLFPDDPC